MAKVGKYKVGDVFEDIMFPDEAFVISDTKVIGKTDKSKVMAYVMMHIPDEVEHAMPSGKKWINKKEPFISNDDVIDQQLFHHIWKKL